MNRISIRSTLAALALVVMLPGCELVFEDEEKAAEAAKAPQTDAERMEVLAEEMWEPKVLPLIKEKSVPLADLRAALENGLDAAGDQYGLRPEGEANPWNFVVSGTGKIVEANTESRAAKMQLDTDEDGEADVTVQLGPVIRGTAIRDAMPFIVFTDFRDQIEFAKLANGLNTAAHKRISLPESDLVGMDVSFEGVFTMRNGSDRPEIVPTTLSFGTAQ
ncbi:DUF2291 family protein [Nitratireductor basaltis]|uniref:Putative periplasmic lipoprotein n=1 Tax=Nitratireductor basaltis TaxID=472175 RepID=A0A084U8P1_9HYPH|nr:DUF2291 domain-containing protein [Nitratireductor basaltis]KFB09327.1 putative periplasmic lipoprotein precursor [Nitratireductor basaltis]